MTPEKSIEERIRDEAYKYANAIGNVLNELGEVEFCDTKKWQAAYDHYIKGRSKSIESEKKKDERIKELEDLIERMKIGIKYKENAAEEYINYLCEILNYPDNRNNQKLIRLYNNWNQSYLTISTANNF